MIDPELMEYCEIGSAKLNKYIIINLNINRHEHCC